MPGSHEIGEEIEHVGHKNRTVAILVSVLAFFLAIAATGSKSMQTEAITENLKSANYWVFFQSNRIQRTLAQTTAELAEVRTELVSDPSARQARNQKINEWKADLKHFESDPQTQHGREQLMARARDAEHRRDHAMERYHHYEVSAAVFEVAIVLASATVITEMIILAWTAGVLGLVGIGFLWLAAFAPGLVHLF